MLKVCRSVLGTILMSALFAFSVCGQAKEAKLLILDKGDNSLAILDPQSLKLLGRVGAGNSPHESEIVSRLSLYASP